MKFQRSFFVLMTLAVSVGLSSSAGASEVPITVARTLKDAYQAALKRSETLAIQKEMLVQQNELDKQAKGALFPTISGTATNTNQQTPSNAAANNFYPSTQNTVVIALDQPLFRGLRDFAALRQRKHLEESQSFALQTAARQLFYDLSTAFYNLLANQRDVANYEIQIQLNLKRLKELEQFYKIGRSQLTDVLTFKANITSIEAQLEASLGLVEQSKEILAFITGWDRNTPIQDDSPIPSAPASVETYLARLEDRPDIRNAIQNVQAYDEGVPIAWGQHLPSIDLLGDYYFARPGALSSVNWDFSFKMTLPIFNGGIIQSQVRQAESVSRQYRLLLSQTRRTGEQEIRTFFDALVADRLRFLKLTELVQISKKNYETQSDYYRHGLVTNLDVLQAITTYQDSQRQLDHQKETVRMDLAKLQAAVGDRSEIKIEPSTDVTTNISIINTNGLP